MSPMRIDRRSALKGLAAGTAALAVPRVFDPAAAAAPAAKGIFGYGVASGDPTGTSVVLWTRATPPNRRGEPVATPGSGLGKPLEVRWEVACDEHFRHVVARGKVRTSAGSDHTVKVDVRGLKPYTRYHYRFQSRGERSPVGHTRTAPDVPGEVHALRFALVSCSNYTGGYFTAYRAIAERDDLDLVLHVGDYIYEYGNGADRYGPDALVGVRDGDARHRDHRPRGLPAAACPAQGRPRRAGSAPRAALDHDLRRPRGRQQRVGQRGREPPGRRGCLPRAPGAGDAGLPRVDAVPDARPVGAPPGDALLQAVHLRRPGRPVDPRDASEPQPAGGRAGRSVRRVRADRGRPGDRRGDRLAAAPPARARADGLAQGRRRAAGQAVAPAGKPGDDRAGAVPGRGPRRPEVHVRQRRPVGRLRGRPGGPARSPCGAARLGRRRGGAHR